MLLSKARLSLRFVREIEMQQEVRSELAQFRINPALLSAAKRQAKHSGMTLSEYFRAAVRSQLREAA